ncbi:MAG: hypothetical protein LBR37_01865, partial [Erysipelotrichaceae bacterium]|nr:hypothetical protein [Erysipelotrichaceae bacterium]
GDIVITSNNKIVCLAGVYGAKAVEIDAHTKSVVLEAAWFDAKHVKDTATRLNLLSDAASHFIKQTVYGQGQEVIKAADDIFFNARKLAVLPYHKEPLKLDRVLETTIKYHEKRLGMTLKITEFKGLLKRIGLVILNQEASITKTSLIKLTIPFSRKDLVLEADITEELIRHLGFDKIQGKLPISGNFAYGLTSFQRQAKAIREVLDASGLYEVITYSLISKKETTSLNYLDQDIAFKYIINPLTDAHEYLRKDLMLSLLRTIEYNYNHQNRAMGIFEISDTYGEAYFDTRLSIALLNEVVYHEGLRSEPYSFYHLKGYLEAILSPLGIATSRLSFVPMIVKNSELHPYLSYRIFVDKIDLGYVAKMHPLFLKDYHLDNESVFGLEISLKRLLEVKPSKFTYQPLSIYPAVSSDFSFIFPLDVDYKKLLAAVKNVASDLISEVHIFDIYQRNSGDLPSVSFSVTYESLVKTLKNEEVLKMNQEIIDLVSTKFQGKIRS